MEIFCVSLLADDSYEAEFVQNFLYEKKKSLTMTFNLTFWYIYNVLSINNNNFFSYVASIYPSELEIKDTTKSSMYIFGYFIEQRHILVVTTQFYDMVAYFCRHLSDNYVDLSDLYVDLPVIYVNFSDDY